SRRAWTTEENAELRRLVSLHGTKHWSKIISVHLPGRSGKQCRERWCNQVNPDINKQAWTAAENKIILLHLQKRTNGNSRWAQLAKLLPGR
ncbi:hypothetical protein ACHAWF_000221, partial [Thalassiosira exigua]